MAVAKTPGVYINELPASSLSIAGVPTAVPAFIGYTEKAQTPGADGCLLGRPTEIASMADYQAMFGGGAGAGEGSIPILWESLRLFFGNGGERCFIVPVGDFADFATDLGGAGLDPHRLQSGLDAIGATAGPTLLLAPDALAMAAADYYAFVAAMIEQAARLGDRLALLDLPGGGATNGTPASITAAVKDFRTGIAAISDGRSYGASYFPWLETVIDGNQRILPATPAIAGLYARNDSVAGVWNAPANLGVAMVEEPTLVITDAEQADMNVPTDGLAVNAIRNLPNLGTMVWGARTLDGNSNDYRYVPARRTLIYIEQSVKAALEPLAFEPNVPETWTTVTAMISSFLTSLWRQGGLVGDTPSAAFSVSCGMGNTMTADDVLAGRLRVTIALALIHPAEFIMLSVEQQLITE
jgi:phage tail sheath protein FI